MVSVLGRFLVDERGSLLLVGALPLVCGPVVSLDISRSVPED